MSIFFIYKYEILHYPIEEVIIVSDDIDFNQKRINRLADSLYGKDLISLGISDIRKYILSDGWIEDAEISKSFPSTVKIKIIQHQPYVIYNSNLMMKDGSIVVTRVHPSGLAAIIDNTNNPDNSMNIFALCNNELKKIDLKIKGIEIYNSLVRIQTSENILISDRVNLKPNLTRLILSYNDLQKAFKQKIESIDMRYSNGFAIK